MLFTFQGSGAGTATTAAPATADTGAYISAADCATEYRATDCAGLCFNVPQSCYNLVNLLVKFLIFGSARFFLHGSVRQ